MLEIVAVLGFPLLGSAVLAIVGERKVAPRVNVAVSLLTFLAAAALTARVISQGPLLVLDRQFFVDPFNVFLVALTAFVGFTTSIFSQPYMRIEEEHGRLNAARLRLYHSMYQLFNFTMLLALLTNNMGILWVAMEAATLTTVLLVSLYRTPASLEAAWKYFILCGVGIAQALFGTILLYFAAEKLLGAEGGALLWTQLNDVKGQLEPTVLSLAFVFLLVGYGTKVGPRAAAQLAAGRARGRSRRRCRRCSPACCSTSRCMRWCAARCWSTARCRRSFAGQPDDGLRPAVGRGRGVPAVAAEGHQAPVRLLVDRAHGHHHLRLRHGRAGRQFRRPAAHDRAFADQVGDLLHRRPRHAEDRHADHGRHPRPDHDQPDASAGD